MNVSLTWTEPGPAADRAAEPAPGSAEPETAEERPGIVPQRRPAADGTA
ncbi:hypothetical protein STANM309S_02385 [Streptomyces tanashiensis]